MLSVQQMSVCKLGDLVSNRLLDLVSSDCYKSIMFICIDKWIGQRVRNDIVRNQVTA